MTLHLRVNTSFTSPGMNVIHFNVIISRIGHCLHLIKSTITLNTHAYA